MNTDEQRVEIAKLSGWSPHPTTDCRWRYRGDGPDDWVDEDDLPDFCRSLDAMAEAEATLTPHQLRKYADILCDLVSEGDPDPNVEALIRVGPELRAKAFLEVHGKRGTA